MRKILIVLFLLISILYCGFGKDKNSTNLKVPTNVEIVAQTSNQVGIVLTVIDLDNNEIVNVWYKIQSWDEGIVLIDVKRTGMFVKKK
jgi:hypothetical protein